MNAPTSIDGLTFDADAFINYSILWGTKRSYYALPLEELIQNSTKKDIHVGFFAFIKDQANRNLVRGISSLFRKEKFYILNKLEEKARSRLIKLFNGIIQLPEQCEQHEWDQANQFYKDNEKDVKTTLNLNYNKPNIPEDSDIKLLVCSHNLNWGKTFLVSGDGHFIAYANEIENSEYDVSILDMRAINRSMITWKWKS